MNTGDFDARIDEAKAKIKSLGDTVRIKTDIDNNALKRIAQDTEAIHRMMGSDRALRIKANLDDADAKVRLAALTRSRSTTVHVRTDMSQAGILTRLLDKAGGLAAGSFGIPGTGMQLPVASLAAIVPAAAAALVEVTGLVSGFAAAGAGAGAGAFAALALPAFKGVSNALSQINKDETAYSRALTDKQKSDALKHLKQDWEGPDPAQRNAVQSLQKFSASYHAMSKAFEPQALKVFSSGLKVIADLLPKAAPFASTFASSMTKLLGQLDRGVQSKGFQQFLNQLHSIEGPALNSIGQGIGQVAASFGRLITVMSGRDVAHTINIAFGAISGTINGITSSVRFLMNAFDGMGLAAHNVASAFDTVRHSAAHIGDNIKSALMSVLTSPATITEKIAGWFAGLPGKIKGFFAGAGGWLVSAGSSAVNGFLNGAKPQSTA